MKKVINLLQLLPVLDVENAHRHVKFLPVVYEKREDRKYFDFLDDVVQNRIQQLVRIQIPYLVLLVLGRKCQDLAVDVLKFDKHGPFQTLRLEDRLATL